MRKSSGRRGAEKEESSGKVKLEAVADMERGGAGANSEAREGGGGRKRTQEGERGSLYKKGARVHGRGLYASKKVGALIEFPRSVTPGTGG